MVEPSAAREPPSIRAMFNGFFIAGLCGFGGVLPWARRMIVEQRKWLTPAEFTEMLGLCQFLPGGNVMNVTVALGWRFQGIPVVRAACLMGLMAAPVAIVIGLGTWPLWRLTATPILRRCIGHSSRCHRPPRPTCWRMPGKSYRRCAAGRWRSPSPRARSW